MGQGISGPMLEGLPNIQYLVKNLIENGVSSELCFLQGTGNGEGINGPGEGDPLRAVMDTAI